MTCGHARLFDILIIGVALCGVGAYCFYSYFKHIEELKQLIHVEQQSVNHGIKPQEIQVYQFLLKSFEQAAKAANLSYFLYGGSLLGWHRHGGPLPWDDDVDIAIRQDKLPYLQAELKKMEFVESIFIGNELLKIWSVSPEHNSAVVKIKKRPKWKWPFLDVFIFKEESENIHFIGTWKYVFPKSVVFPLTETIFMGAKVFIPSNVTAFLEMVFGHDFETTCVTGGFDHRLEDYIMEGSGNLAINCSELELLYKFKEESKNHLRKKILSVK